MKVDRRQFLQQAALAGLAPALRRAEAQGPARSPAGPGGPSVWILRAPDAGFHETWASAELARGLRTLGIARDPVQATRGAAEPAPDAAVVTLVVRRDAFGHPDACEIGREQPVTRVPRVRILGATPRALLYGVFGFLERQGVLFGLDGEVYPLDPTRAFVLPPPGRPWIEQPRFDVRGLVPWPDFLNGIEAFNREDLRAYLEAMVRMRFNTLALHVYSGLNQWTESFLSFEYGGVGHLAFTDTTATRRWGSLPERTSRYGMGSADFYDSDVFGSDATTEARSPWEAQERAQALWRETFRYAARLGIRIGVGFEPYRIPDEIFRATPPEARVEPTDPRVSGARVDPESIAARDILEARLSALLEAYPDVDDIWLWEDEAMTWASRQTQVPLSLTPFLQAHRFLQRHAPTKRLVVSGWGGVTRHFADFHQRLPGDIVFASLSDTFGWEPVSEEYGRLERRARWPVLWLEDDPAMWLPQFHVHRFARDIDRAASLGCQGLLGLHWRHRILDANAGFQARYSWHGDLSPEQFYGELGRTYAREPRAGRLAAVLNDADRDRRLLGTFTGEIKDGRHRTQAYAGDYAEAFAFWSGYEPGDDIKASQAEVARALARLAGGAESPAEGERLDYLARHVAFLMPYAESWSLAWKLHQVLERALALKKQGRTGEDDARALVASEGVPLWLTLAPRVRDAILAFQSSVTTRNDLGTLASIHNKYERLALVRLRASMKEFLGELPAEVEALFAQVRRPDADAAPRVIVPTRPTVLGRGERVRVTAIVPGGQHVGSVLLHTRVGAAAWTPAPMRLRGRRTYEAELAWADAPGALLEYYVEALVETAADLKVRLYPGRAVETAADLKVRLYPGRAVETAADLKVGRSAAEVPDTRVGPIRCAAPLEAPDRVYTVTLLS